MCKRLKKYNIQATNLNSRISLIQLQNSHRMKKLLLLFTLAASTAFSQLAIDTVYPLCYDAPAVLLKANQPGGIWSGQGVTNQNTGQFDPYFAGAGSHLIHYTVGNESDSTIIIVKPTTFNFSSSIYTCNNTADITAEVTDNYLNYDWYDQSGQITNLGILQNAPKGRYICHLKAEYGCALPDTVYVFDGQALNLQKEADINTCFKTASVFKGWNYNFTKNEWSYSNGLLPNSDYVYFPSSGTYYHYVEDIHGCEFRDTIDVTLGSLDSTLSYSLVDQSNYSFCFGEVVSLKSNGNYNSYEWSKWDNNTQTTISNTQNIVVNEPGIYQITVTESTCAFDKKVYVYQNECAVGNDIIIYENCVGVARPGFSHYLMQGIHNYGNTTLSNCNAEITFDDSKETIDLNSGYSVGISGYTLNGNKLSFPIPTLQSAQSTIFSIGFKVSADVSLLGQKLTYHTQLTCPIQEISLENNVVDVSTIIRGSYDPNFVASNYGDGEIADSTSFIKYDVGFQNTGTDTAFNIRVTNFIDTNIFDLSTIKVLGSTHKYYMGVDNKGLITWNFNNILLPDSFINEPASHGQIQFIIQLKKGLSVGTTLKDSANIYFDFNPPIITNTAYNILSNKDGIFEVNKKDGTLNLYPNPANNNIYIVLSGFDNEKNISISIVDVTGREVLAPINGNILNNKVPIQLAVNGLSNGVYIVKATSDKQYQTTSLVIQH